MWILLLVVAVVLISRLAKAKRRAPEPEAPTSFVERMGKFIPADEVFEAAQGWDLDRLIRAEGRPTNPIDRHFLLLRIAELTYRQRQDSRMRSLFLRYAKQHLSEFGHLAGPLRKDMRGVLDGSLPRVPTFQHLATVLAEDGDFQGAEDVCRAALSYDLHDNTKGGFEGRIARIRKQAARAARTPR